MTKWLPLPLLSSHTPSAVTAFAVTTRAACERARIETRDDLGPRMAEGYTIAGSPGSEQS